MNNNRKQNLKTKVGKGKTLFIILGVLVLIVASVIIAISVKGKSFTPPVFDSNAKKGSPIVDDSYLYEPVQSQFGYTFSIAANLYQQEDQSVNVFFTNPDTNDVILMCQIMDKESGKILYESGAINPGEYIDKIKPCGKIENKSMEVIINVNSFERGSWYSKGTTTLGLAMQPW